MAQPHTKILVRTAFLSGIVFASLLASMVNQVSPAVGADDSEQKYLFKRADPDQLNDEQRKRLKRIEKAQTTVRIRVTKLQEDTLADTVKPPVVIPLPPNLEFKMKGYTVDKADKEKQSDVLLWEWAGKKAREGESCSLAVDGASATGLIFTKDKVYSVEPLGKGLHAIVEISQAKFPNEHPDNAKDGCRRPRQVRIQAPPVGRLGAKPEIRVFVAYTAKVSDSTSNVNTLIWAAIQRSNMSFRDSGVNLMLKLAARAQMRYLEEKGSMEADLTSFKEILTGESGQALRARARSDVCVLLVDERDACVLVCRQSSIDG